MRENLPFTSSQRPSDCRSSCVEQTSCCGGLIVGVPSMMLGLYVGTQVFCPVTNVCMECISPLGIGACGMLFGISGFEGGYGVTYVVTNTITGVVVCCYDATGKCLATTADATTTVYNKTKTGCLSLYESLNTREAIDAVLNCNPFQRPVTPPRGYIEMQ